MTLTKLVLDTKKLSRKKPLVKTLYSTMHKYYFPLSRGEIRRILNTEKFTPEILERFLGNKNMFPLEGNIEKRSADRINYIKNVLGNFKPKTILDVGCGDGLITKALANEFKIEPKNMYCIEVQSVPPDKNITMINYTVDGLIPLGDSSIDLIILFNVLHHVHDQLKTLKDIHRVLKPGGILFIREHDIPTQDELLQQAIDIIHWFYIIINEEGDSSNTGSGLTHYYAKYLSWDKLKELVEGVGFKLLHYENISEMYNPQKLYYAVFKKI